MAVANADTSGGGSPPKQRSYDVVAIPIPVIFNKHRDHDPNGMMYALAQNAETLAHEAVMYRNSLHQAGAHHDDGCGCTESHDHPHPVDPGEEFKPHPLVRPLVLRAVQGETVRINFKNLIQCRKVGMHLVGPGTGIASDGSHVGDNAASLALHNQTIQYEWHCAHEGVFLFHDIGDPDGDEDGTNAHGLFGALIVEPEGAWWSDPMIGPEGAHAGDGLYADVHQRSLAECQSVPRTPFAGELGSQRPQKYPDPKSSFREYVVFIHDEPEVWELKHKSEHEHRHCHDVHCKNPDHGGHVAGQVPASACHPAHMAGPGFAGLPYPCVPDVAYGETKKPHPDTSNTPCPDHGDWRVLAPHGGSLMCLNYRSEPMKNREAVIWERLAAGTLKKTVINEEQHHSSWMFGDPDTPVLKAYLGDPIRIRLVHAGVKETHVFHLHVYEWHADPDNRCAPLIDAITIAPGTGHTIQPLFGAGNVQAVPGDVIWHCHLYPHFHMGMWGILRSFDRLQIGVKGAALTDPDSVYHGRHIGQYPDGTPIEKLAALPDRDPPPAPNTTKPGFPLFIAGETGQKSPLPPWPADFGGIPPAARGDYDYRIATQLELGAMNEDPKPGELFTVFPHPDERSLWVTTGTDCAVSDLVTRPGVDARVDHAIAVGHGEITYNSHGWHDPDGHFYYLDEGKPTPKPTEPFFFRGRQGDVLNLTFTNKIGFRTPTGPLCAADSSPVPQPTEGQLERMFFDYNIPPSNQILVPGETRPPAECGLHVHLVKFDPICADGAATGWNYMSGPSDGKKMVYRWWCDEEFGVIFCHDHLFANTRQRHGLFGALIVEPEGAKFIDPQDHTKEIIVGTKAVIERTGGERFREFCIGVGDWIAMYDGQNRPLEYPDHPSSHDDNGTMCVNYRSAPLHERGKVTLPELWFKTGGEDPALIFDTYPNEPIYLRLIQGSHEEQHSFQVNGLRWRRFRKDPHSPQRSQQTLGISEAFTFIINEPYATGDYLWRFSGQEDTWLGCWGLIRAHDPARPQGVPVALPPIVDPPSAPPITVPASIDCRTYQVLARQEDIVYRDAPNQLADGRGLRFVATHMAQPGSLVFSELDSASVEPLILRCHQGEWVEIAVTNTLAGPILPEKHWPRLPIEDQRGDPPISLHVSLDTDLLTQYIRHRDGSVSRPPPPVTVRPGETVVFLFHADVEPGAVLLQDMADIRNHRHHGLFGALIIEPADTVPLAVHVGHATAHDTGAQAWSGSRATLLRQADNSRVEEIVLLLHDGIRYYVNGAENTEELPNPPDIPGDMLGESPDTEDQGQKGFNYRSARLDQAFQDMRPCKDANGPTHPNIHDRLAWNWFTTPPATPLFTVPAAAQVAVRLVCAADKPRNHSFTIHGHSWREYPHRGQASPQISADGGLATGAARTYAFTANAELGDYLYRSGVLKWTVAQGLWGILRVS